MSIWILNVPLTMKNGRSYLGILGSSRFCTAELVLARSLSSLVRQAIAAVLVAGVTIQGSGAKEIEPPDVYQNTLVIRAELEEIRNFMGRPIEWRPEIKVHGAQPREVFFQAITLWVKTNRLCREVRGQVRQILPRSR